ncbi:MAG TPA: hypothetical protein VKI00_13210 [Mycobacterium sp.]|uniref:hypothetical protein n=1 Tax=Mycobacterium sp. TaxID=1785 RepID=UPI002BC3EB8F|nr:hypothetical protein [Mycobacterium sp.]HME76569.1 hypothetical protein [Mycobacterium sp.]
MPRQPTTADNRIRLDRRSNRLGAAEPSRPAKLVTGTIGGIPVDGTDSAPTEGGLTLPPKLVEASAALPEPSPTRWAVPN